MKEKHRLIGALARSATGARQRLFDLAHGMEEALFSVSLSHYKSFTAAGVTGYYRAYRGPLNRSQPVGILFYFDGDYSSLAFSRLAKRSGLEMSKLTDVASHHNLIFIPVIAPFSLESSYTTNWWTTPRINGAWFRELCARMLDRYPTIDSDRIWFAGYSGGAEFITYELLGAKGITPAGATMIAGGGVDGVHSPDRTRLDGVPLTWHVGDKDAGVLAGFGWSAYDAAQDGLGYFEKLGATCSLEVLEGQRHSGYPIADLVHRDLERFLPDDVN